MYKRHYALRGEEPHLNIGSKYIRLKPGAHEYRFVVDVIWFDDPEAAERCSNCFGSSNAVLRVEE